MKAIRHYLLVLMLKTIIKTFIKVYLFSDAEEELNKLAELADRINSQIGADESFVSNNSQNVDLDQLFNFLSQVIIILSPCQLSRELD